MEDERDEGMKGMGGMGGMGGGESQMLGWEHFPPCEDNPLE